MSKLAMSRWRKVGIMLMLLGSGFATVVSMLHLKWLIQFAKTENVTWDYTPVGYWSTFEVHVSIIIACLPALRSHTASFRLPSIPHLTMKARLPVMDTILKAEVPFHVFQSLRKVEAISQQGRVKQG
ncbi:uncharacterized protein BDR25DRAFT_382409 [Lindgomyces ingoldianus]|uniref:Uncharacterized protein n=1 Tax=Lindgomyces ingoldianus TaxID=673940 RepID=A0ACB6RAS4_9PLEO|nr:uncharacterized protein BDR25DRAFT_382409 [Lindgomyces ingoldianus]KAF2475432.1 hypothetical protein BDR25DRAFT_382409 [Lindgomyces ingoldianus]